MMFYKLYFLLMAITLYSISMCRGEEEDMADELKKQFNLDLEATKMAGGHRLPAYAYSGLIMHGVAIKKFVPNAENGWTINWKGKKDAKSFSVAILSNRTLFCGVLGGFSSYGYIFHPPSDPKLKPGMVPLKFICGFPLNEYTDGRDENDGCTTSTKPTAEKFCHQLGIDSFDNWEKHFYDIDEGGHIPHRKQCAFCLRDGAHAYERFKTIVEASEHVQGNYGEFFLMNNEFVVEAVNDPKKLPVKAIYYKSNTFHTDALKNAKNLQTNFQQASGREIPLVAIQFPQSDDLQIKIENIPPSPPPPSSPPRPSSPSHSTPSSKKV